MARQPQGKPQVPAMVSDDALLNWQPSAPAEARALVAAVQARATQRGVALSPVPPEPDNCCGTGCIGCVWDGFYADLGYWRDESVLRWAD